MITLIHAHPYPARSRAVAALLAAVRDLRNVEVRSLSPHCYRWLRSRWCSP